MKSEKFAGVVEGSMLMGDCADPPHSGYVGVQFVSGNWHLVADLEFLKLHRYIWKCRSYS